jgi:hypothetical protein
MENFSIHELREDLSEQVEALRESLVERYVRDLIITMVFTMFADFFARQRGENGKNLKEEFISEWRKNIKKQSKKELLSINSKLKSNKMNFLGAISDFTLPSTEDYQKMYDSAISEVESFFKKNTDY